MSDFDEAERLLDAGDRDGARALLDALPDSLRHAPRAYRLRNRLRPPALPGLGAARLSPAEAQRLAMMLNGGQAEAALTLARALAARYPEAATPHEALYHAFTALRRPREARDAVAEALCRNPDKPALYRDLARTLMDLGEREALRAPAEAAADALPDDPHAVRLAAVAAHVNGARETARARFAVLTRLQPTNGAAHRALAETSRYTSRSDPHLAKMKKLATSGKLTDAELYELNFALGKAFDDLSRPREAFRHYALGNAQKKKAHGLSLAPYAAEVARLKDLPGLPEPAPGTPVPILVVGLPRSGTTLTETILSAHPQVGTAGECTFLRANLLPAMMTGTPDKGAPDPATLARLRDGYRRALAERGGDKAFVVDKMPLNFPLLGLVHALIPEARIVALDRDPMALGWSLFRQCFVKTGNGFAYDFDDIAGAMALYRETLDHWQAEGVPIHRLSYSALTEAPRDTVAALLDALGLPWDDACLSFGGSDRVVATASSLQVRDGIYTGSDGAWQAYAEHLAPLRHALEARGLLAQPA